MDKTATEKEGDSSLKTEEGAAGNTKKRGRGAKKAPAAKGVEAKAVVEKETQDKTEEEKPTSKKAKMAKANTMAVTAKEGAELLGDEKLGESRSASKQKSKKTTASAKRVTSVDKVVEEAKKAFGSLDTSEGRTLRKRPGASSPAKPSLKKAGTMQKTAKEGKAFLKRGRAKKAA